MAAQNPVVLDSSSPPPAFRHPSVTPQRSADASSSPGLPEVSSFFQSNGKVTGDVRRTATALPGFTSAGTLWKAAALEADRKEGDGSSNAVERKSTRKLARPARQLGEGAGSTGRGRNGTPSVPLSEYDFKIDAISGQMQPPLGVKQAAKRTVKAKDGNEVVKKKRPTGNTKETGNTAPKARKRTTKPASIANAVEIVGAGKKQSTAVAFTTSVDTATSRRPSVSMSEFSYDGGEPAAVEEGKQTSAYFCAPAPKAGRSTSNHLQDLNEPAKERHATNVATSAEHIAMQSAAPASKIQDLPEQSFRHNNVSLSAYEHIPDAHSVEVEVSTAKPAPAKKPRKRATNAKSAPQDAPAKKPKKRFAKSASIILNSDEPDLAGGDDVPALDDRRPSVDSIQTPVYAPKSKELSTTAKASTSQPSFRIAEPKMSVEEGFAVWSQSVYFNQAPGAQTVEIDDTAESLQTVFAADGHAKDANPADRPASPLPQTSFSRRRSWTPAKNTYDTLDPEVDSSGESPAARKSLADLVGGFGYDEQTNSRPRSPTGERLTKRRRIDVADDPAAVPAPRKPVAAKEKVKRVKAPKKKPQTITDLATKAYRPMEEQAPNAQSTVSEFFTAQKENNPTTTAAVSTETGEVPATFKKPRKPRARKIDDGTSTTKKTPKAKKVKVKFNDAAHIPPLLSPQRARAKEGQQGFLFGTSSQLALEEDVDYVRDLQVAILESEAVDAIPPSPRRLVTKVSVGHAERRLFWSASRDSWGQVIAANGVRRKGMVATAQHTVAKPLPAMQSDTPVEPAADDQLGMAANALTRQDSLDKCGAAPLQLETSQIVDLCGTSPPAAAEDDQEAVIKTAQLPSDHLPTGNVEEAIMPASIAPAPDDSWMLLTSDDLDMDLHLDDIATAPPANLIIQKCPTAERAASQPFRTATSPVPSPAQQRTALTALDRNIAMLAQRSPAKQQRAFLSQKSRSGAESPQKTLSKEKISTSAALSPRKRGRPPKPAVSEHVDACKQPAASVPQPPLSSDFVAIDDISDSDSDDLPLKDKLLAKAASESPKRRERPRKASQQSPVTSPSKSSFVNLDDISDSDIAKQTPSPRRQKAGGTAPIRTLELSPSVLADPGPPPIAEGKAAMKPSDPCWGVVSQVLFKRISAVVQSTKPCDKKEELSWWEKILMYDPIVLEDFTAWLAGRGVDVEVRRKAVKEKVKKARKKKAELEEVDVVEEEEWVVVKEELKGWMVQKWCEEKSVCCLWKEGLRGGVKVRY